MPLDSFLNLIEELRKKIDDRSHELNEAQTRFALIDPLSRELGWDTGDPNLVRPEDRAGSGSADYALLNNGKPVMMVEAKKLGTKLQKEGILNQVIKYCLEQETPYFSVTNGQRWEIYERHRPDPEDDEQIVGFRRIVQFDLKDRPPAEVCQKALKLWRHKLVPKPLSEPREEGREALNQFIHHARDSYGVK